MAAGVPVLREDAFDMLTDALATALSLRLLDPWWARRVLDEVEANIWRLDHRELVDHAPGWEWRWGGL